MDIKVFLIHKAKFIEFFYKKSIEPFELMKFQIENEEHPYDEDPSYDYESGEPQFLIEWIDAEESIDVIAQTTISMLSASLHLFLKGWVQRLEAETGYTFNKSIFKNGWFPGYLQIVNDIGYVVDKPKTDILEQVALARNRIQHPETLTTNRVTHSEADVKKYPNPYFSEKSDTDFFFRAALKISDNKVENAIKLTTEFCTALDIYYFENVPTLREKYKKT